MGRSDELRARHSKKARKMGLGVPENRGQRSENGGGEFPQKSAKKTKIWVAGLLLVAVLAVWVALGPKDSDEALSAVEERYRSAVGLVVGVLPGEDGEMHLPFATAWAYKPDLFASNAHVVEQTRQFLEKGFLVYIVLNHQPDRHFPVKAVVRHPKYGDSIGRGANDPVPFAYDVGFLKVEGRAPVCFPVASKSELLALKSGDRIGYIGFPMENLVKGGVDVRSPVAIMQSGIITAVSDFWQGDSGAEQNQLIRHNLGVTGGGSGSPIFNTAGKVVAVLNAGNMTGQIVGVDDSGEAVVERAPSAVMINFAQRADLLDEVRVP